MRTLATLLALFPLLAACDDASKVVAPAHGAPAAGSRDAVAIGAAEEKLRTRLRSEGEPRTRAIVVHRQALADTLAVCGQVNPTGRQQDAFLPWVAVLAFEGDRLTRTEFHLAATGPEATRVYYEMIERCWEGGGPTSTRAGSRPLPPGPASTPIAIPDLAQPRAAPGLPAQSEAASPIQPALVTTSPSGGSVMMSQRTPVNLRAHPSGGGDILRTLPRGSTVTVFAEAPGGWLQVGAGEPWGWVHNSLVER